MAKVRQCLLLVLVAILPIFTYSNKGMGMDVNIFYKAVTALFPLHFQLPTTSISIYVHNYLLKKLPFFQHTICAFVNGTDF